VALAAAGPPVSVETDLKHLTCPKNEVCNGSIPDPDGHVGEIQPLRETHHADLVSLVVTGYRSDDIRPCGVA
jgi:hypothetical protein